MPRLAFILAGTLFPIAHLAAADLADEARAERPQLLKQFPAAFAPVTDDPNPARRYKMAVYCVYYPTPEGRRAMVTHWSGDFIHWSQDKSYSFQRHGYRSVRETFHEAHEPAAALVKTSGLKTKEVWPGGELITCANAAYRVRFTFAGANAAQIKFYVGYLE